jgi:Fic family protein
MVPMKRGLAGYFLPSRAGGEEWKAFVPHDLPPKPPLELDGELHLLFERATFALGRLDGLATLLPDPELFLYTYVRKEAVLSSQVEGTQSSLSDLLLFELEAAPGSPIEDVREVSRYVAAMDLGIKRLNEGLPISIRLIKEVHRALLEGARGNEKEPGELRRSQNWIGGTRPGNAAFVPPPVELVIPSLGSLENFLNEATPRLPVLIKAALAHVQFESIHPFLDGNGRIGRLLITLFLCSEKTLTAPLLYLSLYFKEHREEYYRLLQAVRMEGDWEQWVEFFLNGVFETANQAVTTAEKLLALAKSDEKRIQKLGRAANVALRVHHALQRQPATTISTMSRRTGLSIPAVTKALGNLESLGIVHELTGGKRNRSYSYAAYLKILND